MAGEHVVATLYASMCDKVTWISSYLYYHAFSMVFRFSLSLMQEVDAKPFSLAIQFGIMTVKTLGVWKTPVTGQVVSNTFFFLEARIEN